MIKEPCPRFLISIFVSILVVTKIAMLENFVCKCWNENEIKIEFIKEMDLNLV